ncbi:MAG: FixH family protein [Deltaproteobacteria bacterium]|nr:FixH family protein [Deltaproteobacteria bacterium]
MNRLFLATALLACSCGGDDGGADAGLAPQNCATDDRAPTFELGLRETGAAGYVVTLEEASPFPAARDDNDWIVSVVDADGLPAQGLTVATDPQMPDHGHGTPIRATISETAPGTYEIERINLWMPGYWEIGVELQDGEGTTVDTLTFRVCVDP